MPEVNMKPIPLDEQRVNIFDDAEAKYWAKRFGCTQRSTGSCREHRFRLHDPYLFETRRLYVGRASQQTDRIGKDLKVAEQNVAIDANVEFVSDRDFVEDEMIRIRIEASHFLWRMVSRVVGVIVKVGKREVTLEEFERLIDGKCDPKLDVAAWTAPASGLFLEEIRY